MLSCLTRRRAAAARSFPEKLPKERPATSQVVQARYTRMVDRARTKLALHVPAVP
jgi:hypothetical protein